MRPSSRSPFSLLVGLLVWNLSAPMLAQEFIVNTSTTGDQEDPFIAARNDGTFIVAWESTSKIFARQLGTDGVPLGDEFLVSTATSCCAVTPTVAELSNGRLMVGWTGPSTSPVRARYYNPDGTPLSGEFFVNSDPSVSGTTRTSPVLVADDQGGVAAAWAATNLDGDGDGIRFRYFLSNGQPAMDEVGVNSYTTGSQSAPDMIQIDGGDFLVVWHSDGSPGTDNDFDSVQAARVSTDGNLVGSQFQVNTNNSGSQNVAAVTAAPDGTLLVAWEGPDGNAGGIHGRLLDNTGSFLGDEFQINTYTFSTQTHPTVVGDPEGFLVVWTSGHGGQPFQPTNDFFGQRLDTSGIRIGSEFKVAFNPNRLNRFGANAAASPTDGLPIITWHSDVDGSGSGISVRRLPHFFLQVTPQETSVCEGQDAMYQVAVTGDGTGSLDPVGLTAPDFVSTFEPSFVTPGESADLTLETSGRAVGEHPVKVVGDDGTGVNENQAILKILANAPLPPELRSPLDGATEAEINPLLFWNAQTGETYSVEVAADPGFTEIIDSATGLNSTFRPATLERATQYYWRVRSSNSCGQGVYSPSATFTTGVDLVVLTEDPVFWNLSGQPRLAVFSNAGEFVVVSQALEPGQYDYGAPTRIITIRPTGAPNSRFVIDESCNEYGCPAPPGVGPSSSAGEFVVVWTSDAYNHDSYAQSWDVNGPSGTRSQLPGVRNPAMAAGPNGEFLIAWGTSRFSSSDVRAQRVDSNGTPLSADFLVNSYTTGFQGNPAAAYDPVTGEFLVAWEGRDLSVEDSQDFSILARRYASDGTPIANDFQVNSFVTGNQRYPAVSADLSAGGFLVVWESPSSSGEDAASGSIQGRRVAGSTPLGEDFQINHYTTDDQSKPAIAVEPASETFLVSWTSEGSAGTDTEGSSIQARRLHSSTLPIGEDFQVNLYTPRNAYGVQVAASPGTDEFIIMWRDPDTIRAARLPGSPPLFADSFESGDLSAWGGVTGVPACIPRKTLDCADNSSDSWNNAGPGSTAVNDTYPCLSGNQNPPEIAYTFVAPTDGTYALDLSGLEAFLVLAVLQGSSCDPATCIAGSPSPALPGLTFFALAGETYTIVVDGNAGQVSDFTVGISCP